MSSDGFFELKIQSVVPLGDELIHLTVGTAGTSVDSALRKPGQYVRMTAGGQKPGFFAIASPVTARGSLEFVLKKGSPLVDCLAGMKAGDPVRSTVPEGNGYPMDKVSGGADLWLFAMGTGITPIRPVIEYALANPGWAGKVHLYYGCRRRDVVPFAADLDRWRAAGIDVDLVISSEVGAHIQTVFEKQCPLASGVIFACGKKEMISDLKTVAARTGIGEGNVFQNF